MIPRRCSATRPTGRSSTTHAIAEYRYNSRNFQRGWADNAAATRQFLMDNHVRFSRIQNTHDGGGMTKGRAPYAIMKLGDKTDIEAGTITTEDAGSWAEERQSRFNPQTCFGAGAKGDAYGAPGTVIGGFVIARSLEYASRKAGVRFMLNRHLDEIIREGGDSGRIIGVKASYTPRFSPKTGERLESYWSNGNIDERKEVIYIRARRAVVVGTGGWQGNVPFRTQFDPRKSEPSMQWGSSLMGPLCEDASGILAGMKVGAGLGGLFQAYHHTSASLRLQSNLAAGDNNDRMMPGHPAFEFMGSFGIPIGGGGWEYIIAVNQVGKRFYDEISTGNQRGNNAKFPPGTAGTRNPFTPLDWRNASVEHIRSTYVWGPGSDAALAMNEGSRAPDYNSGPVWAIFDQAAVDANGWQVRYPYIADPPNGFFFKADTIAELAHLVVGNKYQQHAAQVSRGNRRQVQRLRRRRQGRRLREADHAQDRQGALLCRDNPAVDQRFLWRTENRRPLPGHRHIWEPYSGPLCGRRGLRWRPAARHRPRVYHWLHSGDERGCRTGWLIL